MIILGSRVSKNIILTIVKWLICAAINCVFISLADDIKQHNYPPSLADVIEPLMPAVVNIYNVKYNKNDNTSSKKNPFDNSPLEQFGDFFEHFNMPFEEMYSDPKAVSLGSGFIIHPSGYIVTNYHVVNNVDEINIKFHDNIELPAKLIGSDPKTDLALLKVEAKKDLPFVRFGDSSKVRVGDWLIAVGNPFGFGGTVTVGIISSKGRDIGDSDGIVDDFIQTDAAINRGNSGGPAFNLAGEVIGINTAIFSYTGVNIGIGFAIPSNTAQNIIEQLKKTGKVSRGRLDIIIQEISPELAEGFDLDYNSQSSGALVVDVTPGGAGDKAGIKAGDIIIEFAGQQVKTSRKLQVLVGETPINTEVKLLVLRGGKKQELIAKIQENNKISYIQKSVTEKSGVVFSDITDEIRLKYNIKHSVKGIIVLNIKSNKNHGLLIGDIIVASNNQLIENINQFNDFYKKAKINKKKNIVLLVKRQGASVFIALPIT